MQTLFYWMLAQLKVRYWGVALEGEIPAEFVITAHARKRFRERVRYDYTNDEMRRHIIRVWFRGRKLTAEEARASEDTPRGLVDFQYREFLGFTYVFGMKLRNDIVQKYLVTIYKFTPEYEYAKRSGR